MSPEFDRKSEPVIRETSLDDVIEMRKMQAQSWLDTYPNEESGVSHEWVKEVTDLWLIPEALENSLVFIGRIIDSPDNYHCVAIDNGKVVGCSHVSNIDGQQVLQAIYVDKDQHGKGVAKKLMDQSMSWLDNTKPIELEVADYNDRAIAFYRKYGFEIEPGSEHKFNETIPTINMIRKGDKK